MMRVFLAVLLLTTAAPGDVITDWNQIMRTTIAAQSPPAQARYAAITHLAIFEAVNAIAKDYQPYLGAIMAPGNANQEAAAAAAAHGVLRNYFPANASSLDASLATSLAAIPESVAKSAGIAAGQAAAAAMIAVRTNDGSGAAIPYTPLTGVSFWQPTPPAFGAATLQHWAKVTPFAIFTAHQFRPRPPPDLSSGEYRKDSDEVKTVGDVASSSTERPQDRADVARFFAMTNPVQTWNPVAVQLAAAEGATLPRKARIFALMNMAIADAAVAAFEAKYFYHFWRPVTSIRAADDGNAKTEQTPGFTPFITTPPYPSYPSNHGSLSNAARYVLEAIFGRSQHQITLSNPALPGVALQYTALKQIADDIADARVYAGIHFRFDQDEAETLGRNVARFVLDRQLRCASPGRCE